MAQGDKSAYYQALKKAGYEFEKHYRDYTTAQLKAAWEQHAATTGESPEVARPEPKAQFPPPRDEEAELRAQLQAAMERVNRLEQLVSTQQRRAEHEAARPIRDVKPAPRPAPKMQLDPNEHAGSTMNTHGPDDVIEVDEYGNEWYQKEVTKPAYPKPRGRRVLKYEDPGVVKQRIPVGDYVEEFEVAGDPRNARPAEIKITLPSYQTGIFKPPNMPFRVHTYQGVRGFNLFDVQRYYGGADLVPSEIKRMYVSTDLCYDITTTIRAIENEYRERVLKAEKRIA